MLIEKVNQDAYMCQVLKQKSIALDLSCMKKWNACKPFSWYHLTWYKLVLFDFELLVKLYYHLPFDKHKSLIGNDLWD